MANSQFFQFQYSKERMVVNLSLKATIGSTGAVTMIPASSKGIASIARNATGKYTITLRDVYNRLLQLNGQFIAATVPASPLVSIVSEDVDGNKTIVIQCSDVAGAAADPASG